VGCKACSRTGRMKCRKCGGGGTGVPIMLDLKVRDDK
jgi:hypothetical protein